MSQRSMCVRLSAVLWLAAGAVVSSPALGSTLPNGFTDTLVAGGLNSPTAMDLAPDGRIFLAEKGGRLRVVEGGTLLAAPFVTLDVATDGEQGLVGVVLDPLFASNQHVYVYYTATTPTTHNRVSRFTASGNAAVPGSEDVIIELDEALPFHNGGSLHFGPDGALYVGVGDGTHRGDAQELDTFRGKILRMNPDGTVPSGNPSTFDGVSGTTSGIHRTIWAVGLRNPFTTAFQVCGRRFYINDVGEGTYEEIDRGAAGANYGWPVCEGVCEFSDDGYRDPIFQYPHGDTSTEGCAITGGAFYDPLFPQFPASYAGAYFFADYCNAWIRVLNPSTKRVRGFLTGAPFGIVDLDVSPDGALYYLARGAGSGGSLRKITYPAGAAGALVQESSLAIEYDGWRGIADAGASGGGYRVSNRPGDRVTFSFEGDAITWRTQRGPDRGIARVEIDGQELCECDLYAGSVENGHERIFDGLSAGRHTIAIEVLASKNAASSDTAIVIDGFAAEGATLEESSALLTYNSWSSGAGCSANGIGLRRNEEPGSFAAFGFPGDAIEWITKRGPRSGKAQVLIDSVDMGTVDLYARTGKPQVVRAFTGLGPGPHRIEIRVLAKKNRASGGRRVVIDAFRIPAAP